MDGLQLFTPSVAPATLSVLMRIEWDIGDVIRKLRKRARMNQTVLAAKVGVNKATIVRAEAGDVKVSRATYLKIAEVLKTDIAKLEVEAARLQAEHQDRQSHVSESHTADSDSARSLLKRDGKPLAIAPGHGQADPVSGAARAAVHRAATDLDRLAGGSAPADAVEEPARAPRAVGEHAATPRSAAPRHRPAPRKRRR